MQSLQHGLYIIDKKQLGYTFELYILSKRSGDKPCMASGTDGKAVNKSLNIEFYSITIWS